MKKRVIITTIAALVFALGVFAFVKLRTISIKFIYNNDSTVASTTIKIKPNSKMTLLVIDREGYAFQGWYLNDNLVTNETVFKRSCELEAKWLKIYKVTFDYGKEEYISFYEGDALEFIDEPVKEGYTFQGWYDFFENKVEEGTILEPKDITLYARFKRNK